MISDGMDGDLIEELMSSEGIYLDYLPSSSFNVEFLVLLYIHAYTCKLI